MGRDTDFEFGANTAQPALNAGSIADYISECMGMVVCDRCGKQHGRCAEVRARVPKEKYGMNVGAYVQSGQGERNPFISAKDVGKASKWKIIACRPLKTPKFNGLMLDLKNADRKRAFGVSFERFDLGAIVAQVGSDDTDDWVGCQIALVSKKGKNGKTTFVNVAQKNGKRK
jgi:hypothetical protein